MSTWLEKVHGFRPANPEEVKRWREYFRNNLLPVLVSEQRRKELGADKAREYKLD